MRCLKFYKSNFRMHGLYRITQDLRYLFLFKLIYKYNFNFSSHFWSTFFRSLVNTVDYIYITLLLREMIHRSQAL